MLKRASSISGLALVLATLAAAQARLSARGATVTLVCAAADSLPPPLERAVGCAESFIRLQGYTSDPPSVDSTTIAYELLDLSLSDTWRGVLQRRRGELTPNAIGICADSARYIVVFKRAAKPAARLGRAVEVANDFSHIRMVHHDWSLHVQEPGCHALGAP